MQLYPFSFVWNKVSFDLDLSVLFIYYKRFLIKRRRVSVPQTPTTSPPDVRLEREQRGLRPSCKQTPVVVLYSVIVCR